MRAPDANEREMIVWLVSAVAITLSAVAIVSAMRVNKRLRTSVRSKGRILESTPVPGNSHAAFRVKVEFTDEHGATRAFTSRSTSSEWKDAVGQDIGVIYLRDDPEDARVDHGALRWMLVITVASLAVLSFGVAAVLALVPNL